MSAKAEAEAVKAACAACAFFGPTPGETRYTDGGGEVQMGRCHRRISEELPRVSGRDWYGEFQRSGSREPVLSEGQWSALLFGVPDQYRPLVVKLAIHHGAMEPPRDGRECALCGRGAEVTT